MIRIHNSTALANMFTNGNPVTSLAATIVEDYWLNNVQEEICKVIEDAGLTLDQSNTAQLKAAINVMIGAAVPSTYSKLIYQAVVGSATGCTHANLAAALADAAVVAGSRILVTSSETVNSTNTVSKANMQIELMPGVVFTKGSATKGLLISANGVRVKGGKFTGFSTAGDKAVEVAAGSSYAMIGEMRFSSNDTDINDLNGTAATYAIIAE